MNISLLVKQARLQMKLLQKDLAKLLGVHQTEISKWENGIISIPVPRLALLYYHYKRLGFEGLNKDFERGIGRGFKE